MNKIILSLALIGVMAVAVNAATVNLTVEVSDKQIAAANYFIAAENARRAAQDPPLDPLPGPKEYMEQIVIPRILNSWVVKHARVTLDTASVRERWEASTNAQRQAALDALAPAP